MYSKMNAFCRFKIKVIIYKNYIGNLYAILYDILVKVKKKFSVQNEYVCFRSVDFIFPAPKYSDKRNADRLPRSAQA